jgi:hypothetical protein
LAFARTTAASLTESVFLLMTTTHLYDWIRKIVTEFRQHRYQLQAEGYVSALLLRHSTRTANVAHPRGTRLVVLVPDINEKY